MKGSAVVSDYISMTLERWKAHMIKHLKDSLLHAF